MRRGKFGQHFLVDAQVLWRIIEAGNLSPGDLVLEVGVGEGTLTEHLAKKAKWVIGFEIDGDLLSKARERLTHLSNVVLLQADVLDADLPTLLSSFTAECYKCIANLPYGISTPFFFKLLKTTPQIPWERFVVMVQYEFGEKLLSLPPHGKGNPLSVGVARVFAVERLLVVPPSAFRPNPRVFSLLLCGKRKRAVPKDYPDFLGFVTEVFRNRRKKLRNLIPKVALPPKIAEKRAEDLTLEEWERLWEEVRIVL